MATKQTTRHAHVCDWIEARGLYRRTAWLGQIVELIGRDSHERYRVCWDEMHESIVYPADGVIITPRRARKVRRTRREVTEHGD